MAKVSVVMCCYNAEKYIKETIDSVLGQTFEDFEFIIWNDGSTDSTMSIVESYSDPRIKVFTDINRGEGMAAQLACRHATAKYIARVDSDDVWLPEKLSLQYAYMENHPQTVMMSCPVIYIDKDGKELGYSFPVTKINYLKKSIYKENRFPHSGSIYRTDIYLKVGGYNNIRLIQDYLLFLKMCDYGDLALWNYPLIKYRLLSESVSNRIKKSPYNNILYAINRKISQDKGAVEKDIEMFNTVYNLIEKTDDSLNYQVSVVNRIHCLLSILIGKKRSYKLIVSLLNILHC